MSFGLASFTPIGLGEQAAVQRVQSVDLEEVVDAAGAADPADEDRLVGGILDLRRATS